MDTFAMAATEEGELTLFKLMEYQADTLALCDQLAEAGTALEVALQDYVHAPGPMTVLANANRRLWLWRDVARCRQTLRDVLARYQNFKRAG